MTSNASGAGSRVTDNWDRVFKAISSEPRRQLLISLFDAPRGDSVPLPQVAINSNHTVDVAHLRLELIHSHLPQLEAMEFIQWDLDPLVATRGPRFDEVAVVFRALCTHATELPDSLVVGCQRFEAERRGDC